MIAFTAKKPVLAASRPIIDPSKHVLPTMLSTMLSIVLTIMAVLPAAASNQEQRPADQLDQQPRIAPTASPDDQTQDPQVDPEAVRKETQEAIDTINAYSQAQRDQAIRTAKTSIDRVDRRIEQLMADLQSGADGLSQAAKQRREELITDLRKRRGDLAAWYGSLQQSSADAWEDVKSGFVASAREMSKAMIRAREHLSAKDDDEKKRQQQQEEAEETRD